MPLATDFGEVQRRRNYNSIRRIRARHTLGRTTGKERAVVRVGIMGTRILTGQEDLTLWSNEELIRGKRRDKNGGWMGREPVVVPKAIHDELVKRTLDEAHTEMVNSLVDAVKLLGTVVNDTKADNKDRLTAAKMIIDRTMGREPLRVDVQVRAAWEDALEGAVVTVGELGEVIIDADSYEEDDDDDNPFKD